MKFVLVVGDPVNGIDIIGPFDSSEEAVNHGDIYYCDNHWVMTEIIEPTYVKD